jgi:adenylate kinase
VDGVVLLRVADEEIVRRLGGRWNCPKCGATYHLQAHPPKRSGICDACGTRLMQRDDDKPETVAKRLQIFHSLCDGLAEHYRKGNLLIEVAGVGDIAAIDRNIEQALGRK